MRRASLRGKIVLIGAMLSLAPMLLTLLIVWRQNQSMATTAGESATQLTDRYLLSVIENARGTVESGRSLQRKTVERDLATTRAALESEGGASLSKKTVDWDARNQFTGETTKASLPKLLVGEEWIGQVFSVSETVPVVDVVGVSSGATATIFQRMNEDGDMLRVATSVIGADAQRAIGTYISARNPDGTENAVVGAVLRGERYTGRAYVVDQWYGTVYEPLEDAEGNNIGMLYAGVPESSAVAEIKVPLETAATPQETAASAQELNSQAETLRAISEKLTRVTRGSGS